LVARTVRVREVGSSNLPAPTEKNARLEVAKRSNATPSVSIVKKRGAALLTLAVGMFLSSILFFALGARRRSADALEFQQRASEIASALVNGFDVPLETLHAIPALYASSADVSREEFQRFVTPALTRHPSIYSFEWIPEVPGKDRAKWEARARREGLTGFEFTEVGPNLQMIPAKPRELHVPIYYMEPRTPLALGFDLASEPARLEPYQRAKLSGKAAATGRIRLVEDPPSVHSIAVFHPVTTKGKDGTPRFAGAAVEVFRFAPVVERALRGHDLSGVALELLDQPDAREGERSLYGKPLASPSEYARRFEKPFAFADRNWSVVVASEPPADPMRFWVLATSLVVSILAAFGVQATSTILRLRRQVKAAERLGQYTLVTKLGEGGMGEVYQATHAMLRRPTAVKLLQAAKSDDAQLARFEREVQLTAQLTHPNTIAVYDYGRTPNDIFYYAMEYVDGIDFAELVAKDGPLVPGRVVFLMQQVLGALSEAHSIELIHRDVKPANLMLCERGGLSDFVKVLDFGLAKRLREDTELSNTRELIGTPHYLAPEAISGDDVGPASDIYAVGAVMYFLLTGTTVFQAATVVEICSHHLRTQPTPPSQRTDHPIPADLEQLVLECLAKEPGARPQSASALGARLGALTGFPPWTQAEATLWWQERGEAVTAELRARRIEADRTIDVEISHRRKPSDS
jgi:CHASE1-domain containing sensor protein